MVESTPIAKHEGLPFRLPARPSVTRVRQVDPRALRAPKPSRLQPMAGFEEGYADIVDFIVRITEEIWVDRAVGTSTTPMTTPARSIRPTAWCARSRKWSRPPCRR